MARPTPQRCLALLLGLGSLLAGCEPPPPPAPQTDSPSAPATAPEPAPNAAPAPLVGELATIFRLIERDQTGPARVRLRKHLALDPEDAQAHFLFGLTYHREKMYAKARPHFERALVLDPAYSTTNYFLGWDLYYLGEPALARVAFETHLAATPDSGDTHFALGLIALDDDELDEADAHFARALALAGDRAKDRSKVLTRQADVAVRRGAFETARDQLEEAVALFPDHYEAFYKLFRVQSRLGATEAAEAAREAFVTTRARLYPGTRFPE